MSWLKRSLLDESVAQELRAERPEAGKVLAVGTGGKVLVVAGEECLAVRHDSPSAGTVRWQFIGWHTISRGGWRAEKGELRWSFVDQSSDSVQLDDPGKVPEVFRDRVRSSIVVEQMYDVPGGGHVVVAGRRRLGGRRRGSEEPGIVWQVSAMGRARLSDPEVAALATEHAARLRADYE